MQSTIKPIILLQIIAATLVVAAADDQQLPVSSSASSPLVPLQDKQQNAAKVEPQSSSSEINQINNGAGLEPRTSDKSFIADIINRLHSLDTDIGRLLFNSSSMYAADDQSIAFQQNKPKGTEPFTEVLTDLDTLQDEIGGLINNATRTHQYNILVRLRPVNTILYRIRHNLHLMRNSLVTVNAIASLERVSNTIMDTTLQAFLKPDADVNDELGDSGNYDIDLNKSTPNSTGEASTLPSTPTTPTTLSITTTTTTITTTTAKTTTPTPIVAATNTTTHAATPTRRSTRPPNRRTNNRSNQRSNTTTTTSTTTLMPRQSVPRD